MMHRAGSSHSRRLQIKRLLGVTALTGVVLTANMSATVAPANATATRTSSCVACHTDAGKLKAEAALVPVPSASALQAGKG